MNYRNLGKYICEKLDNSRTFYNEIVCCFTPIDYKFFELDDSLIIVEEDLTNSEMRILAKLKLGKKGLDLKLFNLRASERKVFENLL